MTPSQEPFKVVICGGGVAALEGALALRELAGDRVAMTMLAPQPEFVYRPMTVREPFGYATAHRYPLDEIARDIGLELRPDTFERLESEHRTVITGRGERLSYDALLLGLGASVRTRFEHAVTLDDRRMDEQLHGLIQDVEDGYVHKLAFVAGQPMPWPLPIYELALMTARRAYDMNDEVSITLVTPEEAPLAIFGGAVSETVERLLQENGILTITSAHADIPGPGQVSIRPGSQRLQVERIVALPELVGPSAAGVPKSRDNGFIPIDTHCQVPGAERVYAAGDATDFAVKHGSIAAQQADTAAEAIAALAGAPVQPSEFHPVIHGVLLGGDRPLYLSAHLTGGHGTSSEVSEKPTGSPLAKIHAKYLAPYLDARDRAAAP